MISLCFGIRNNLLITEMTIHVKNNAFFPWRYIKSHKWVNLRYEHAKKYKSIYIKISFCFSFPVLLPFTEFLGVTYTEYIFDYKYTALFDFYLFYICMCVCVLYVCVCIYIYTYVYFCHTLLYSLIKRFLGVPVMPVHRRLSPF